MTDNGSPLGVCVLTEPEPNAPRTVAYPGYVHEILGHAGLCYATIEQDALVGRLPTLRLLVTIGETDLPAETRGALKAWVKGGGAWLAVGGVCGLPDIFGVEVEPPAMAAFGAGRCTLGEGYLRPDHPLNPMLGNIWMPLHFFNGLPVRAAGGQALAMVLDAHQRPTHRAALVEAHFGDGHCLLIAPDVTGTVVRIQQGTAVTRDGVPASDGTGAASDGVLKSDDGAVLDWYFDRQPVHGVPGFNAFTHPIADQWREVLLRAIFLLARGRRLAIPLLWLYPRNLPAVGEISHDSDLNEPENARAMLGLLREVDVASTWCIVLPGYDAALIQDIREAGHELAMHYDAMSEGTTWSEDEFADQWRRLTLMFGEQPTTNKNHYLRWEGDTEFFEWLSRREIRFDQSKGASKTGEAGFNFGTCHPYFPVTPDGDPLDVLEVPTVTQDLEIFAPRALLAPLLDAAERHHGILHLLFHPAHILKPGVADALTGAVNAASARGFEWWTARRIDEWERARREVSWSVKGSLSTVSLNVPRSLDGATVLWLSAYGGGFEVDGLAVEAHPVDRWGFRFQSVVFDAGVGEHKLIVK